MFLTVLWSFAGPAFAIDWTQCPNGAGPVAKIVEVRDNLSLDVERSLAVGTPSDDASALVPSRSPATLVRVARKVPGVNKITIYEANGVVGLVLCEGDRLTTWFGVDVRIQDLGRGKMGYAWLSGGGALTVGVPSRIEYGTITIFSPTGQSQVRHLVFGPRDAPQVLASNNTVFRVTVSDADSGVADVYVSNQADPGGADSPTGAARTHTVHIGDDVAVSSGEARRVTDLGESVELDKSAAKDAEAKIGGLGAPQFDPTSSGTAPALPPQEVKLVVEGASLPVLLQVDGVPITNWGWVPDRCGDVGTCLVSREAIPLGKGEHLVEAWWSSHDEPWTDNMTIAAAESSTEPWMVEHPGVSSLRIDAGVQPAVVRTYVHYPLATGDIAGGLLTESSVRLTGRVDHDVARLPMWAELGAIVPLRLGGEGAVGVAPQFSGGDVRLAAGPSFLGIARADLGVVVAWRGYPSPVPGAAAPAFARLDSEEGPIYDAPRFDFENGLEVGLTGRLRTPTTVTRRRHGLRLGVDVRAEGLIGRGDLYQDLGFQDGVAWDVGLDTLLTLSWAVQRNGRPGERTIALGPVVRGGEARWGLTEGFGLLGEPGELVTATHASLGGMLGVQWSFF